MTAANRVRRLLAVMAFVASSAALLATSPAMPPTKSLEGRASAETTLTSVSPVVSTVFTFSASDEALWSDDPEITITTAMLTFSTKGTWHVAAAPTRAAPGEPGPPIVRLTVMPLDGAKPLQPLAGGLTSATVDPRTTCPSDRDCRAEYQLLVEWVDPTPGLEVSVVAESVSLVQIQGSETLPIGARTGLEATRPIAVEIPLLSDGVHGSAQVDASHPLSMWSVALDADAGAIPSPLGWPIESRGSFVATVTPGPGQPPPEYGDGPGVSFLLIPDVGQELIPVGDATARLAFDPYEGCQPDMPCRRRLTVVVRWFAANRDSKASVDWRLDAGIAYHGDVHPVADARVRATVDAETHVRDDGAVIAASAEGVATLDQSRPGISLRRTLQLEIPALAMASDLLGGPVPAVTARVRLEARSSAPVGGDPISILTDWSPGDSFARPVYRFPDVLLAAGPIDVLVFPATACRADRECTAEMRLGLGISANAAPRLEGVEISVAWRVDVELHYPNGSRPPDGATMDLRDVDS